MNTYFLEAEKLIKEKISPNNESVLIFGASRAGLYHLKVFEKLNIKVVAFIDNNTKKQGVSYLGLPVISLNEALNSYPNSNVAIALMDSFNMHAVLNDLEKSDFNKNKIDFLTHEIVNLYLYYFSERKIDQKKYKLYKNELFNTKGILRNFNIAPSFTLVVTERCNLNCDHCAAWVPQNKEPKQFTADSLIRAVENYSKCFDFIYRICIMGGETFLHKDIKKILSEISKIENILFIDIATNGTVIPQDGVLEIVRKNAIGIEISDYGVASKKMNEFFKKCEDENIIFYHQYYGDSLWGELGFINKANRPDHQNNIMYLNCLEGYGIVNHVLDGKVYRCLFSGYTHRLNKVPDDPNDYVDLTADYSEDMKNKLINLTYRTKALSTCDYCMGDKRKSVPAGIQLIKDEAH